MFRDIETCGYLCAFGPGSNRLGVGSFTQRQSQCIDEYGFSGAGFTGQRSQAIAEFYLDLIHDRQVAYMQVVQHGVSRGAADGRACHDPSKVCCAGR